MVSCYIILLYSNSKFTHTMGINTQKMVLLRDATSPVPGFEKLQDDMISDMMKLGMKISTTTEFLS